MAAPEPTPSRTLTRQVIVMFEPTRVAPTYLIQVYIWLVADPPAGSGPAQFPTGAPPSAPPLPALGSPGGAS